MFDANETPKLCCNWIVDILNWDQVGHWTGKSDGPDWYGPETVAWAKNFAAMAQPADVQLEITEVVPVGSTWMANYRIFDAANPWVDAYECGVSECHSERRARQYCETRYAELKRLHDGDMACLVHYRETGIATMQDWQPDGNLMGYRTDGNGKMRRVKLYKRLNEAK